MATKKQGKRKKMSADQFDDVLTRHFSFSELHKTVSDVKSSIWRLNKVDV